MRKQVIRILEPGDEASLEAFLLPLVESSMFLIGNMRTVGLIDTGQPYTGSYAAAFDGESIRGVVAHYWNQNLVLQAPVHLDLLWPVALAASSRPIGGVIGPNEQVAMVKEVLAIDEARLQLDSVEKLYSLKLHNLVVPDALSSGQVKGRRIKPRDLDRIARWRAAFAIEALGEQDSPELRQKCRAEVERALNEQQTWLLETGGQPVACSSFNSAIREAVQVGGVWTPPELRRRGYGRAVVAASLLAARSEGVNKAILFTGEHNISAQKAYTALGFRHIGDYRLLLLRSPLTVR